MSDNEKAVVQDRTSLLYRVKMVHSSETEVCRWNGDPPLEIEEDVVVPSRFGKDLGRVLGPICGGCLERQEIYEIVRRADEKDLAIFEKNKKREDNAFEVCREMVEMHRLDMKLVSAHFLTEESKLLFFFTADERVDFRELVKDLVSHFHLRIELRQIGVRDESRVLGGLAVCGRPYCCHGVTDKLKPVSIKMAKEQNLSLNSMKISGPCGRLLCCLSYEYDFYREEKKNLPAEGSKIRFNRKLFKIREVNILGKYIRIDSQDGRYRDLPFCSFYRNEETGRWEITELDE